MISRLKAASIFLLASVSTHALAQTPPAQSRSGLETQNNSTIVNGVIPSQLNSMLGSMVYSSCNTVDNNCGPGFITPMAYGCSGLGIIDDTACVQAAINAAATAGVPLYFDSKHLYNIASGPLVIANPLDIEGAFRYGIWTTTSNNSTSPACLWGLTSTANGNIINATAITGTIRNLCIQAATTGSSTSASAGAAINLAPPSVVTYSTGWDIEANTIINPYDGIAINGAGYTATCCGAGTSADGISVLRNTVVNPAHDGIGIGKNTGGSATAGITLTDNGIVCNNTTSKAAGRGIVLYDGGIAYDGTTNGPEACNIGMAIIPGTAPATSVGQYAQIYATGVLGDQSGSHGLLIQPQTSLATVAFSEFDKAWASNAGNANEVLISNTNSGTINNITFIGSTVHTGANQTATAFDVETSASAGTFNNLIIKGLSLDCWDSTTCTQGMLINSLVAGQPAYVEIEGVRFGAASPGSGTFTTALNINTNPGGSFINVENNIFKATTGLVLTTPSSANTSQVNITGNNFGGTTTPISYTPNPLDVVIISNNIGIDTNCVGVSVVSNSVTLLNANNCLVIGTGGTPSITNIGPPWVGREIELQSSQTGGYTLATGGTPYPLCTNATIAQSVIARLLWRNGGTCWTIVQ